MGFIVPLCSGGSITFKFRHLFLVIKSGCHIAGENRPVTKVPAPTNHRQVDTGLPCFHHYCNDVNICMVAGFHALLFQHFGKCHDAVTYRCSRLKLQTPCMFHHLFL